MVEDQKYKPLMEALGREVDQGAAMIDLWDFDHGSNEPRAILGDDALLKLASRKGKPLYVIELVGAAPIIEAYAKDTDAEAQALGKMLIDGKGIERGYIPLFEDMRAGKLSLSSPDPRMDAITPYLNGLSKPDRQLIMGFFIASQSAHPGKTSEQSAFDYIDSLTEEQRTAFVKVMGPFASTILGGNGSSAVLDTTAVDTVVAERVRQMRSQETLKGHTTVMIYGAAHFTKTTPDLDELALQPGEKSISVAVRFTPATGIAMEITYQAGGHTDLPDYAWYSDQNRLVKLDNDVAKAEFLGIKPEEVATFQKTGIWPSSTNDMMVLPWSEGGKAVTVPNLSGPNQQPITGDPTQLLLTPLPVPSAPSPAPSNAKGAWLKG